VPEQGEEEDGHQALQGAAKAAGELRGRDLGEAAGEWPAGRPDTVVPSALTALTVAPRRDASQAAIIAVQTKQASDMSREELYR
jgi:hypothetical protein